MKRTNMPLEALVTRWEDRREIQNLMGRYTYALLLSRKRIFLISTGAKMRKRHASA